MLIASSHGGVNIEDVAAEDPSAIIYEPIDITKGLTEAQALAVINKVGLGEVADNVKKVLMNMYDMFVKKDALLVEINPFAEDAGETCKKFVARFYCGLPQYQFLYITISKFSIPSLSINY